MQIKSIYVFEDLQATGIDIVPVTSLIQVNGDSNRASAWYYIANIGTFSSTTTIAEMLLQTNTYSKVGTSTVMVYDYANNDMHFKIKG